MSLRVRILVGGGESDIGIVDMIEIPAGHMPPLHVHHNEDEGFYASKGEAPLYIPGDYFLAPRGVPHAYRIGDTPRAGS